MIGPRAALVAAAAAWLAMADGARAATALDLAETLRQVATANPALAARAAAVDAARHRVGPAGAWPAPTIEAGVVNVPTTGGLDSDPMTMQTIGLAQTVPVFGGNGLARRAARAEVVAAAANAEQARFDAFGAAWQDYADAYYANALAGIAVAHRDIIARMIESARARYETGHGRLEDVLRSEAEQSNLAVDAASFRAEAIAARARLDALRGVAGGVDAARDDSLAPPPETGVSASPDPWLAALVDAHPRLREHASEAERYRLAAGAERRRAWPDLELRGSYGYRQSILGAYPQFGMFSASVGLALPLFAGNHSSQAAEMDAMARQSDAERRSAGLTLYAEIVAAHATALGAQSRATLLADTVITIQRRALEAASAGYRAGGGDLWRVFESAHALYDEEVQSIRARQDLAHAIAQLVALTGRTDLFGVTLAPGSER